MWQRVCVLLAAAAATVMVTLDGVAGAVHCVGQTYVVHVLFEACNACRCTATQHIARCPLVRLRDLHSC
jgi:hypothetical protein